MFGLGQMGALLAIVIGWIIYVLPYGNSSSEGPALIIAFLLGWAVLELKRLLSWMKRQLAFLGYRRNYRHNQTRRDRRLHRSTR
jgi:hypothetical protein